MGKKDKILSLAKEFRVRVCLLHRREGANTDGRALGFAAGPRRQRVEGGEE